LRFRVDSYEGNQELYLLGRASAEDSGVGLVIDTGTPGNWSWNFGALNGGVFTPAADAAQIAPTLYEGLWYTLRLRFSSGTVSVYLDGSLVSEFTDPTPTAGGFALYSDNNSISIDDLRIYPLLPEYDSIVETSDLPPPITSGNIRVRGQLSVEVQDSPISDYSNYWVYLSTHQTYTSSPYSIGEARLSADGSWYVDIPAQASPLALYAIYYSNEDRLRETADTSIMAYNSAIVVNHSFNMIELSGTVSANLEGVPISDFFEADFWVSVYEGSEIRWQNRLQSWPVAADGTWNCLIRAQSSGRTISTSLYSDSKGLRNINRYDVASAAALNISGLDINIGNIIVLSGTLQMFRNGVEEDLGTWEWLSLRLQNTTNDDELAARAETSYINYRSNNAWELWVLQQAATPEGFFMLSGTDADGIRMSWKEIGGTSIPLNASASGIALILDQSSVSVSGTLSVNVGGITVSDITAYGANLSWGSGSSSDFASSPVSSDGSWTLIMDSSDLPVDARLSFYKENYQSGTLATLSLSDSNVAAGDYTLNLIEVSGELSISMDGGAPDSAWTWDLQIRQEGSSMDASPFQRLTVPGAWQYLLNAGESSETYTMYLIGSLNNGGTWESCSLILDTVTLHNSNVYTDNYSAAFNTVQGSIDVSGTEWTLDEEFIVVLANTPEELYSSDSAPVTAGAWEKRLGFSNNSPITKHLFVVHGPTMTMFSAGTVEIDPLDIVAIDLVLSEMTPFGWQFSGSINDDAEVVSASAEQTAIFLVNRTTALDGSAVAAQVLIPEPISNPVFTLTLVPSAEPLELWLFIQQGGGEGVTTTHWISANPILVSDEVVDYVLNTSDMLPYTF
jgi:hypothetical protein